MEGVQKGTFSIKNGTEKGKGKVGHQDEAFPEKCLLSSPLPQPHKLPSQWKIFYFLNSSIVP